MPGFSNWAKDLPQMKKILLKFIASFIASFIVSFIGLAACNEEQTEGDELEKIARGEYKYTLSYKSNDLFTDKLREYCTMPEEYFEMFFSAAERG